MGFLLPLSGGYVALASKVGGLRVPAPLRGNATNFQMASWYSQYDSYYTSNASIMEDVENLMYMKTLHELLMFWYSMIFLMRWFKGFRGQARMAQITSTMSSAGADLIHFGIIFLVLFVNFALAGHVLFGHEVPDWSSPVKSLHSSLAMAYGRVDFAPMYDIAPVSGLMWLFGYVVAMVMLSMNLVLAIIADHYGGVFHANNAGDKGYDLFGQLHAMFYELWWNFSYSFRNVYRILYDKWFPYGLQNSRFCPYFPPEERRMPVPYDTIYAFCEMN